MGAITKWLLARTLREAAPARTPGQTERIDTIWEQFDQGTQRAILRLTRSATMDELAAAGSALATLGAPALVAVGRAGPVVDPGIGATYAEVLPDATLERIPDAGHWPWMDRPAGGRPRGGVPGGAAVSPSSSTLLDRRQLRRPAFARGLSRPPWLDPKRAAPTVVAGLFAIAYVIVSPPSLDLAAHLLRAKLFSAEGFGVWNNWWYGGHHVPGYSVLFPPIAAALTPQVAAGLAACASATLFEILARDQFGEDAWLGALWFGAGTATNLFTGRLTFAFGLLPAIASALALSRRRTGAAVVLGVLTALASPVAALFAALAAAAFAIGRVAERPAVQGRAAWSAP